MYPEKVAMAAMITFRAKYFLNARAKIELLFYLLVPFLLSVKVMLLHTFQNSSCIESNACCGIFLLLSVLFV